MSAFRHTRRLSSERVFHICQRICPFGLKSTLAKALGVQERWKESRAAVGKMMALKTGGSRTARWRSFP